MGSFALLKKPLINNLKISKGAVIISDVDVVLKKFPLLKKYFYIIERRGWEGICPSYNADIKLVEDLSYWDETKIKFPNSILLDIAGADFVDTDNFKPISCIKEYDGIQISTWQKFKRPELFFEGTKLLSDKKFIKFGHLIFANEEELQYRKNFFSKSYKNVYLPFSNLNSNEGLPNNPQEVNKIINTAKIGILTSKVEGINRFKLECMAANLPVIVPNDVNVPLKKHINNKTGVLFDPTPEGFAKAIKFVEKNYNSFSPREYVLHNTGNKISMGKLKGALKILAERDKSEINFDDIYWDGRNQSSIWDQKADRFIQNLLDEIQ
jgi:hypothetical protein